VNRTSDMTRTWRRPTIWAVISYQVLATSGSTSYGISATADDVVIK
jgi:hypothetical protein